MNNYALLFALLVLSSGLSYLIMHRLAHLTGSYWFYRLLLFPGIALHESAHAMGCLITGTPVEKISLWTETGGSMTHYKPKLSLITQPIISFAPMIVGLVALFFLGQWIQIVPWAGKIVTGILMISVAATLSPSKVDIVHSIEGLIFLAAVLLGIAWADRALLTNFDNSIIGLNTTMGTIVVILLVIFIVVWLSELGLKKARV